MALSTMEIVVEATTAIYDELEESFIACMAAGIPLSCIGFHMNQPEFDIESSKMRITAQIYFFDGFVKRIKNGQA